MADSTTAVTNTVTISNAATFDNTLTVSADLTLIQDRAGRIVFTDRQGNVVKSRQRDLKKLFDRLHIEQHGGDEDYNEAPSVA